MLALFLALSRMHIRMYIFGCQGHPMCLSLDFGFVRMLFTFQEQVGVWAAQSLTIWVLWKFIRFASCDELKNFLHLRFMRFYGFRKVFLIRHSSFD